MVKLVAIYSELPFWLRQLKGGCIRETLIPSRGYVGLSMHSPDWSSRICEIAQEFAKNAH